MATTGAPGHHRPRRRLGLRARATAAFTIGALVLSLLFAVATYAAARSYLLRQRENVALRQTYVNARLVRSALRASAEEVPQVLASLETPAGSNSVLERDGEWFATAVVAGRDALPPGLRAEVLGGQPARQRFRRDGVLRLAIGVPLPAREAAYFEVFSLEELDDTLRALGTTLAIAATATTLGGAAIGRWGSRRVLKPVSDVAEAASAIAGGRLDTRLEVSDDPDLAALASSFNEMVDALRERIARDARFASDVSHELRSPLTTLAAALEVLQTRRGELPERSQAALDLLSEEVQRFERLVQDLLEISRLDAGASELALDEVRLGQLVLHAVEAAAPGGELMVDLDAAAAQLVVRADKRRIERVLANLMENARIHGGGVVRIAVEHQNGHVRLAIEDAGPGVPPEDRERIFERFSRGAGAGRRGRGEGSGLGLALVAEHVRLHGGRAWVEERESGGSRFLVELPVATP